MLIDPAMAYMADGLPDRGIAGNSAYVLGLMFVS